VEVEGVEPVDERVVKDEEGMAEDPAVPPFLERDERSGEAVRAAGQQERQAGEIEPGSRTRPEHAKEGSISLFDDGAAPEYRKRWMDIQARFVDDPRGSVQEADRLVEQVVSHITDTFARQRSELEAHWNAEGDTESSTEDLRLAVKRYHTFFDQLLNLKA